jgi:hypothetical protein
MHKNCSGTRAQNIGASTFCAAWESDESSSEDAGAAPKSPVALRGAESYGLAFLSSVADLGAAAGMAAAAGFQKSGLLVIQSSAT